jgi:Sulfotransferase domain
MPLKVIGVGFGRTGTMSLTLALDQLGFGRCNHMASPDRHPLWIDAADGKPDWERIFEGFNSTTDYPSCNFWRQLSSFYPQAKILLSVRDPNKWFDSTQATIFSPATIDQMSNSPSKAFFEKAVWVGIKDRIHDRDFMVAHFNRHVAEVKRAIPKERLLIYDVKEGWEPLCAFLGVAVPSAPFPSVNSTAETQASLQAMRDFNQAFPKLSPEQIAALLQMARAHRQDHPELGQQDVMAFMHNKAAEMSAKK